MLLLCERGLPATESSIRKLQPHSTLAFVTILTPSGRSIFATATPLWFCEVDSSPHRSFRVPRGRIGLYAVRLMTGIVIGVSGSRPDCCPNRTFGPRLEGLDSGLYHRLCSPSILSNMLLHDSVNLAGSETLETVLWVFSCVASCFAFLLFFRGLELRRSRLRGSLSPSAYVMYLIRYVVITRTQKTLISLPIHASIKAAIIFASTVPLSWLAAQVLLRIP